MNIEAVADKLLEENKDFIILCAGSNGMFSLEDTVCAGKLVELVKTKNENLELSDSAKASLILSSSYGNDIKQMLEESEHGLELINAGYKEDLEFISKMNSINIVPYLESGVIKIKKKNIEDNSAE
jgi:2-phosphosulfolactate phosphatase